MPSILWLRRPVSAVLLGRLTLPGSPMKTTTTKIRFTETQIALVLRAHPNSNLDHLTELSFEFDQAGKIIDCIGTIKEGGYIDHDHAGSGLARLYEMARRRLTGRQTSVTVLQFPNGREACQVY